MALFSFRHSVKTFSEKRTDESRAAKVGQTAAHLRYITRPQAARTVLRQRLKGSTDAATAQEVEEAAQRRKGRACERFIVALPVEATPEQREALVRAFAEKLTGGVAGYIAAIHDKQGNDQSNPHFHLVAFDVGMGLRTRFDDFASIAERPWHRPHSDHPRRPGRTRDG